MSATVKPAVVRRLFLTPLLVLLSALAYHGAVHPAFQVIRVPLIDGPRQPTGHLVRVVLPDLSVLRPSVPILIGRLANGPARRQRARLLLGGVSRAEVDLAPGSGGSFALVLSEGTARAITGGTGGQYRSRCRCRQRRLAPDLPGRLKRLCGRRSRCGARAHPGPRRSAHAVGRVDASRGARHDGDRLWGRGQHDTLRRLHQIAAAVVVAALAVAWLLPVTSNRRVLVTPLVFWVAIAVLFLPGIIAVALATRPWATALAGAATRFRRRHSTTCERGGILLGLVAMAIVQPVFDVVRASPEFFVARNTTFALAVTAATIIGLGLPFLLLVVERGLRSIAPRAATGFFIVAVATLLALMIHPWLRRGRDRRAVDVSCHRDLRGRAAGVADLAGRGNAPVPGRPRTGRHRRARVVLCQSGRQRIAQVVVGGRAHPATWEHATDCADSVRRIPAPQLARRRRPDRPGALSSFRRAGARRVVVSRDHDRVVADGLGRARHRERQVSRDTQTPSRRCGTTRRTSSRCLPTVTRCQSSDGFSSSALKTRATTTSRAPATTPSTYWPIWGWCGCISSCRRR